MFKTYTLALLEYIKDQLLFNDTVTLPGFGSFEIKKTASSIKGKKIVPPGVQINFNPQNSKDDKVLAKSIAEAEEISLDEASQKVLEYIDLILFALNKGEAYTFEGFGILTRDSENIFKFEKDPNYKVDYESFGLESFELDPIESIPETETALPDIENKKEEEIPVPTKSVKPKPIAATEAHKPVQTLQSEPEVVVEMASEAHPPKENKNNKGLFWILTGAIIVILISFVIIKMGSNLLDNKGLTIFSNEQSTVGDFPEDENWDIESALDSELGEVIDSMTTQENALSIEPDSENIEEPEVVVNEYLEFHIIAGSFKDKINAGILQQSLTEKGYPALVIQQGDNLYRVSAISFKDKDQGIRELENFKKNTKNNAAWLLKLK